MDDNSSLLVQLLPAHMHVPSMLCVPPCCLPLPHRHSYPQAVSKGAYMYKYTRDLLALEAASPELREVPYDGSLASPLRIEAWERALSSQPDRNFVHFLLQGLRYGFRIGARGNALYKPAQRNLKSAYEHPQVVSAYLQREVELGHLLRLPAHSMLAPPLLQLSPFSVIPKKYKPDK